LTAAEFASFTYTTTGNCNYQARWYINIRGTDDVTISGASFPGVPGGIVYNVIGCDRTITVTQTALAGHLLAPCSDVNQPDGVITGKVVARNVIASRQINRENTCPAQTTVQVPVVVASMENNLASFTNNFLIAGDNVDGKNVVAANGDNSYEFDAATAGWTVHQVIFVPTDTHTSRTATPVEKSSAATVAFSVVLAFVALLF